MPSRGASVISEVVLLRFDSSLNLGLVAGRYDQIIISESAGNYSKAFLLLG